MFFPDDFEQSRRLFTMDKSGQFKLLIVRPWDVPAYVEQGAADLGVAGLDVLKEQSPDVYILKDLKFGACKLVIAGHKGQTIENLKHNCKVVTKYPNATKIFFHPLEKIRIINYMGQ